MKQFSLVLVMFLFAITSVVAQKTVSGTITDDTGEPLIGANVVVKGTSNGASTDFDGKYSINDVKDGDVLVITYTGFEDSEITVGAESTYDAVLSEGVLLESVVVTGVAQGISEKKIGFAIAKIDSEQLEKVPAVDAGNALRGKTSGVRIVQASGNPASGSEIRLRGSTNINGSQSPLILIDGVITNGSLSDINMEDVESIEVLKGAAASSLYGSLAGNGVIQILTKRGAKAERTSVKLRTEVGMSSLARDYPVSDRHRYLLDANGEFDLAGDGTVQFDPDGMFDNEYPRYFENEKNLFTSQPWRTLSAQVASTTDKFNYFIGLQNLRQEGIIEGVDPQNRNSVRANVDFAPNDKWLVKTSVSYVTNRGTNIGEQGQGNIFYYALASEPYIDWTEQDADGNYVVSPDGISLFDGNQQSPFYQATEKIDEFNRQRLIGGLALRYDATDWLRLNADYSLDQSNVKGHVYFPKGFENTSPSTTTQNGYISKSDFTVQTQVYQASAYFHEKFGKLGTGLTLKYLYEDRALESLFVSSFDLAADVQVVQAGQQANLSASSTTRPEKADNIFAYLDLDWDDKLIFNGLVRRDGSSLFGEDARYRVYGRGSLAYILTEDISVNNLDFLKLRVSYGTSGQRPYSWFAQYYNFDVSPAGLSPASVGNTELKPSVVAEFETGFNATIFKRLNIEFSYSDSRTTDDVLFVPTSPVTGFPGQFTNAGAINSNAIELSLSGDIIRKKDFNWSANINFDRVRQTIGDLDRAPFTRDTDTALSLFRVESGLPYGAIFGNAIVTSRDQLVTNDAGFVINAGGAAANTTPDQYMTNEDGYLVYEGYYNTEEEQALLVSDEEGTPMAQQIGNTNPDFNVGIGTTITYKGLSVYGLLDWQQGGDIYNYTKQLLYFNDRHRDQAEYAAIGKHNAYSGGNSTIYNGASAVSHFVEDGSFMKLRELAVSYRLDGDMLAFADGKIDNITLSITGRNLLTFTQYSGWDPEVAIQDNPTNFKIDEFSYPNFRTFTFGLQVGF